MRCRLSSSLCAGFLCSFVTATTAFGIGVGDTVRVTASLNVRNGPDTNYQEITDPDYPGTAPGGTVGKVIAGPQSASGYTWWRVDFGPGSYMGWVVESGLKEENNAGNVTNGLQVDFTRWGWTNPVPIEDMYVSSFGGFMDSRYPKAAGIHLGVDLLGPSDRFVEVGTPVFAVCSGTVVDKMATASYEDVYNSAILIVDGSGVAFVYGHVRDPLKGPLANIGDSVAAGQQIAEIGPITYPGAWPKAHLHFGVNTQGHGYFYHPQRKGWGIAPNDVMDGAIAEKGWVDPLLYLCEHPATKAEDSRTSTAMENGTTPASMIGRAVDYPTTNPAHYRNAFDKAGLRGYCTWYVAERWLWARDSVDRGDYVEFKGQGRVWDPREELPSTRPACKWLEDAERKHLLHVDYAKPVKGSIAVFGATSNNSPGHVAYVEGVDEKAGTFYITEMNGGANPDPKTLKTEYFNKITAGFPKIGATTYKGMKVLGFIYPPDYALDGSQGISDQTAEEEKLPPKEPTKPSSRPASIANPADGAAKPQTPAPDKPGEPAPKAVAESEPQRQPQSVQTPEQERLLYSSIQELKDGDDNLRREAAASLGKMKDPRAVEPLVSTINNDQSNSVRLAAIWALGEIRDPRPVPLLISVLRGGIKAPSERFGELDDCAASALSQIGEAAVGPLISAFESAPKEDDANVERLAEEALRGIRDPLAIGPLMAALKNQDWHVREVAAHALEGVNDHRAIESLIDALADENPIVRGSVGNALVSMTGEHLDYDRMEWKKWWETKAQEAPQAKSNELPAWVYEPLTPRSSYYSPRYPRRLMSPASEISTASDELVYLIAAHKDRFQIRNRIDQLAFLRTLIITEMKAGLKGELETLRPEVAADLKNNLVRIVEQTGEIISLAGAPAFQNNLERIKSIQSQINETSRRIIEILQ